MKSKFLNKPSVHIILITLIGLFAYSNTFDVPFDFDDRINIVDNHLIRDISNIPSLLTGGSRIFSSRALMHATFAVNYYFGGLDTTGYHIMNLALHLLNGILLYLLVSVTGRHLGYDEKSVRPAAALSYVLFVIHPVQTEAVTNVVNRSTLFATAFYLSGMMLFLKAVASDRRRGFYIAGLFATSLLGMGSRENFAMFPLMLLLYDLFFVSRFKIKVVARHYLAYLPVLLSLGYMAHLVLGNTYARRADIAGIPPVEYALTQFKVHWTYIRMLLLPVNQSLDYDYPLARNLLEGTTLISIVGYVSLWAGGIVLARRRPVLSFSVLWFLITLLPISFMIALTDLKLDDVIFEHRLYLPGVGGMVAAGIFIYAVTKKIGEEWHAAGKAVVPSLLVLAVALTGMAYARNAVWNNEISLWEDAAGKAPGKARPHINLGIAYKDKGNTKMALEQYEVAIRLDPAQADAYINLGNIYYSMGLYDKAIQYYRSALLFRPYHTNAHYNIGVAYHDKGMTGEAKRYYSKVLELDPYFVNAHYNLGIIYLNEGAMEMARREFERVLEIQPAHSEALQHLRDITDSRR